MAATVDSSSTSPQSPPTTDSNSNSPNFPGKNLVSPWSHIVRGGDSESTATVPQSSKSPSQSPVASPQAQTTSDSSGMATASFPLPRSTLKPEDTVTDANCSEGKNCNVGLPKKQAWKKPPNGIVEPAVEMDILSWPLLSEINKAPAKVPANSSNVVADGSLSTSQGSVPSNQKQGRISGKVISGTNHTVSNRHRFVKAGSGNRNMGAGAPVQSTSPHPPLPPSPPPFPVFPLPPANNGTVIPLGGSNWDTRLPRDFAFQSHGNIDHQSSGRRGSFRPQPHGDASNKDGANYPNSKDGHVHQCSASPRGLVRPPPPFAPPPMGHFVSPMGFPDYYYFPTSPMEPFRGMPFFTHGPPPAMFFPVADSPQTSMLIKQIDYYFSDANLAGDEFLKSNMDKQGWVPIALIASFPRVKNITSNVQLILNSLRSSAVVEVNDDRVRRRNDWVKWIPTSVRQEPDSSRLSPFERDQDNLETSFQNITNDKSSHEGASDPGLEASQGNGSTESEVELQLPNGNVTEKLD